MYSRLCTYNVLATLTTPTTDVSPRAHFHRPRLRGRLTVPLGMSKGWMTHEHCGTPRRQLMTTTPLWRLDTLVLHVLRINTWEECSSFRTFHYSTVSLGRLSSITNDDDDTSMADVPPTAWFHGCPQQAQAWEPSPMPLSMSISTPWYLITGGTYCHARPELNAL